MDPPAFRDVVGVAEEVPVTEPEIEPLGRVLEAAEEPLAMVLAAEVVVTKVPVVVSLVEVAVVAETEEALSVVEEELSDPLVMLNC